MATLKFSLKYLCLSGLLSLCILGCKDDDASYFNGKITTVAFNKQVPLQGQELNLDSVYAGYMSVYDTLLTFASSAYPEHYLYVFGTNSGKLLGKLCPQGRGPGEYLNFTHTEQYSEEQDGIKLWVSDGVHSHILLNLTASLRQGKEVRDSVLKLEGNKVSPHGFSLIFVLDNGQVLTRLQCEKLYYQDRTYLPERYVLYAGDIRHEIETFRQFKKPVNNPNEIDPTVFYNLQARIKPDKSKLATAMRHLGQISILDIKNGTWQGFRIENAPGIPSLKSEMKDFNLYYTDICTDDRYIYALFVNKPVHESDRSSSTIHVFNWEGIPQYAIQLAEPVLQIAVDPCHGKIYGKNGLEQVFCYTLPASDRTV